MVIETEQIPFVDWIRSAPVTWLAVVGILLALGIVIGYLIAAVRHGPLAGLRITGRVLLNGVLDLALMSPRRVWALTWLAVRDALRRRIVVVFGVFIVVLSFAGWFLDPGTDEPARLYISFVLTATSYLVLLLALFLSVFSLPADLKSKTLHTIVTKPVRASEIVLARMLGFTIVGTVLLAVMGVISYVFVVRGLAHVHEVAQANLVPVSQAESASGGPVAMRGVSSRVHGHRHDVLLDADGNGRLEMAQSHWHAVTKEAQGDKTAYVVGQPQGLLVARVSMYGKLRFVDNDRNEKKKGRNVGDEWTYRSYIEGGTLAAAIWTFEDVRPETFPKRLQVEMTLGVFRTYKGDIEERIPGSLLVRNPKTGLTAEVKIFKSREFSTDIQYIPREVLPTNIYYLKRDDRGKEGVRYIREEIDAKTTAKPRLDLFEDFTDDGKLEIWLQCLSPQQFLGAAQADMYLRARDASFAMNVAKGYFGIWMQMVLVVGFGVMFSTFLSGPVAMIATVGMLLGGFFRPFMMALAEGVTVEGKKVYGGGPVESLIRMLTQQNMIVEMEPGLQRTVAETIDGALKPMMKAMAHILPEFNQFSSADYVAYGFNISSDWVAEHGLATLGFFVALFVAGYFFLKTREVAK